MEKQVSHPPPGNEGRGILSAAENGRRIRSSSNLAGRVGSLDECELPIMDEELGLGNY